MQKIILFLSRLHSTQIATSPSACGNKFMLDGLLYNGYVPMISVQIEKTETFFSDETLIRSAM